MQLNIPSQLELIKADFSTEHYAFVCCLIKQKTGVDSSALTYFFTTLKSTTVNFYLRLELAQSVDKFKKFEVPWKSKLDEINEIWHSNVCKGQ